MTRIHPRIYNRCFDKLFLIFLHKFLGCWNWKIIFLVRNTFRVVTLHIFSPNSECIKWNAIIYIHTKQSITKQSILPHAKQDTVTPYFWIQWLWWSFVYNSTKYTKLVDTIIRKMNNRVRTLRCNLKNNKVAALLILVVFFYTLYQCLNLIKEVLQFFPLVKHLLWLWKHIYYIIFNRRIYLLFTCIFWHSRQVPKKIRHIFSTPSNYTRIRRWKSNNFHSRYTFIVIAYIYLFIFYLTNMWIHCSTTYFETQTH